MGAETAPPQEDAKPSSAADAPQRTLPQPQLQTLYNSSSLPHFQFMDMGQGRKFYDVVIVKASFDLQDGIAQLSQQQAGPSLVDEFYNEDHPEYSSMKAAGDTVLFKPFTDVYVTGAVRSFQNAPQTSWHGLLRVRRGKELLINKTLKFTGPRQWEHKSKDEWRLTKPIPTTQVPLQYELAYGGHYLDLKALQKQKGNEADKDPSLATETFAANPSGSGMFSNGSPTHLADQTYPGPQIEWEADRISTSADINFKTYQPAGWGPIARWWSPRVERQGTYDDAWMKDFQAHHCADYPRDFNNSYFNCAPPDQMVKGALQGNEFIELVGVFGDKQTVSMQLPGWQLKAGSLDADNKELYSQMRLDTLHLDLDKAQLNVTWRLTLDHSQQIHTCVIELIAPVPAPPTTLPTPEKETKV